MDQYFSCIITDIFCSVLVSFKLLFLHLTVPFHSCTFRAIFSKLFLFIKYVLLPQSILYQPTIHKPYAQGKQTYPFYALNACLETRASVCNRRTQFSKVFCFRSAFLVSISLSEGCQPYTACCTGINDNTFLNPSNSVSSLLTNLEPEAAGVNESEFFNPNKVLHLLFLLPPVLFVLLLPWLSSLLPSLPFLPP